MRTKIEKAPKTEARDAFLAAIAELDPTEITWGLNALADHAAKRIIEHRNDIIRLRAFGKDPNGYGQTTGGEDASEEIARAEQRCAHQEKLIKIAALWRAAKNEFEIPKIVAALKARG